MDILEFPDARPVPPEVHEQILEPFITAACGTLAEMAQTESAVRSTCQTTRPRTLGDISAVLGLTADGGDLLVLSFPAATAVALAGRVLADAVAGTPEQALVHDCMGELGNVIAGQAKTMLAETPYQLRLATPRLLEGSGLEIGAPGDIPTMVAIFGSDAGDFSIQICMRWHDPNTTATARDTTDPASKSRSE